MQNEIVDTKVSEMENIVNRENLILFNLIKKTNGILAGKFNCRTPRDYDNDFRDFMLKTKANGLHFLFNCRKAEEVFVTIFKSTKVRKGFLNEQIINGKWKDARNYATCAEIVDAAIAALNEKINIAKKENLQELSDRVENLTK